MLNKTYLWWSLVAIYLISIFVISSFSTLPAQLSKVNDKLIHFLEFFILALLLVLALIYSNIKYPYAIAIFIAICFAALDEFHQLFVLGRTASIFDFLADSSGALTILLAKLKK